MLAAGIDSLIFLILVGVAALLRWLASKGTTTSASSDSPAPPDRRSDRNSGSSDDEQIRKFLEALGQPRDAKVPPPVPPRTDVAPRPVAPVSPPPSAIPFPKRQGPATARPEVTVPKSSPVPPPVVVSRRPPKTQPTISGRPEVPTFEVYEAGRPQPEMESTLPAVSAVPSWAEKPEQQSLPVAQLLRNPGGLRQAIILREIFGPPRSLQPLEFGGVEALNG